MIKGCLIEKPNWQPNPPDGWQTGEPVSSSSSGWHTDNAFESRQLPNGDFAVQMIQMGWMYQYAVWSSKEAKDIYDRSIPHRDIEGHGGHFFPSDYKRLKIDYSTHTVVCIGCGQADIGCYDAVYYYDNTEGYLPYCKACISNV